MGESSCKHQCEPWRVLEFYSGIGGMRYSIMKVGVNAVIVEAFDINDVANDVYEYNFGHRPCQLKDPTNQGEVSSSFKLTTIVSIEVSEGDEANGSDFTSASQYFVPLSLIKRWGAAMDIVYPDSKRCCCFTESYYRYVKGTGSLLATVLVEWLKEMIDRHFFYEDVDTSVLDGILIEVFARLANFFFVSGHR